MYNFKLCECSFHALFEVRPLEPVVAPVASTEAPVTPIVATQELRSFFQQPEAPVLNTDPAADLEVIDLRGEEQAAGFPLINDDGDVEVEDAILPETIIEEEQEVTTVGAVEPATTTQTPAQTATTDGPQVEFINRNASNDLAKSDGIVSFL